MLCSRQKHSEMKVKKKQRMAFPLTCGKWNKKTYHYIEIGWGKTSCETINLTM